MSTSKAKAQSRTDQVGPKSFKSPTRHKTGTLSPITKHGNFVNGKRGMGKK